MKVSKCMEMGTLNQSGRLRQQHRWACLATLHKYLYCPLSCATKIASVDLMESIGEPEAFCGVREQKCVYLAEAPDCAPHRHNCIGGGRISLGLGY